MVNKITYHLKTLAQKNPAIFRQFMFSELESKTAEKCSYEDPLLEEEYTKVKGLVHKYPNRVLILLTLNCAAYCRFCTRRRKVSEIKKGIITDQDLDAIEEYLKNNPQINELIFSGGDPVTTPDLLKKAILKFSQLPQIKVMRIGTRVPISDPDDFDPELLKIFSKIKQALYLLINFEHPSEITEKTKNLCLRLHQAGVVLFSQSIFLKDVNDNYETLYELFSQLIQIHVKPYYIYHCDPVKGAEHFIVPLKKEVGIMTKLRKNLSGLAFPLHVIDTPNGTGKIPVPLDFWQSNKSSFKDFNDQEFKVID